MCPASRSSVCTRWVRLLKALASSMTRIGLTSLHDLGANLIPGDPSGWEPHDRAECPPPFLGHDREGTHYPRSRHGLHDWSGRPGRAATPRSLAAQRMSSRPRRMTLPAPSGPFGPKRGTDTGLWRTGRTLPIGLRIMRLGG